MPNVLPPLALPLDPLKALRALNVGIGIHPRTAMPGWTGERLDLGYAMSVLHPLAVASRC